MSAQIDLVKFLFLADIDLDQAEYILDNYTNFTMSSYDEFFEFFKSNGIVLKRVKQRTTDDRLELIEKFKAFRRTYEYEIIKKYVGEEKKLELLLTSRDPLVIKNALDTIRQKPYENLNTFDYYVIKKILTGSENGVLPSEKLKTLLEEIITVNDDIFPEDAELVRDENGRITSFQNIFRNSGTVLVPMIYEKFVTKRFNYVLDKTFQVLADAVTAERNILKKLTEILSDPNSQLELEQFLSDITNLIREDENTVAGLEAKVARLEQIIEAKQQLIESMVDSEIQNEAFIDAIATDNIQKDSEIETKDSAIATLNETIDETLTELQQSVSSQINTVTAAIDTLSQSVVASANSANSAQDQQIQDLQNQLQQLSGLQGTIDALEERLRNAGI